MYTILYVDDEPVLLDVGKHFLERSGEFRVDIITSAPVALTLLNEKAYDAIISDYQMPDMDGIEFLKKIRSSGNAIPFILFTGRGREEVVIQALNEGADFYLQKGGEPKSQFAELSNKIRYSVTRRRAEDALKLERGELLKKNEELNASYEQITAIEEELRSNLDDLAHQGQVIRESEERYRNVVEDQTEFISRFKPDGTHVFANEAYCRYFGLKREEIVGHRFRPKIPVEDRGSVKRFFESLTPDHPVDSIEHRIIMSDGSICWQRWSDRIIFDKNGRIAEYQSVGADITEQKNAEEKLRSTHDELNAAYEQLTATEEELRQNYDELNRNQQALVKSEERYRNVVEDQTEFICRFGPDGTHVFINEAYCRYFDMRREEIMGHRFRPKIPVEDQDLVKRFFKSLTPDRPVDSVEHRIIMPDGSIRWQRWSDRAIFDKNGHIREYQSVGRDTTDKKNAENELRAAYEQITAAEEELRAQYDELKDREQVIRESEQKLQGIVQGSPIPQFVLDENQRVISWNRALEEYSGVKAKEVLGTTHAWKAFYDRERPVLSNLLMKDTPEKIQELYAGKFNKSKYVDGAYEATDFFPRMGGHGIWLHFTAALIRDSKGDIIGAVETLEDITERTRADEELRISYEQITASEEELRHQFDELKKSEDALRQSNKKFNLLSGITWHDITNQLTLLEAYITLINEQQPDLSSNEYFKRATLSIQRITTMIQFSKEYENIGVKDPLWQNCHTLVDAATKQILFGDPVVKNDLPAGAEVFADPLVFEVFYNLIDNAVRHGMEITTIRFSVENRDGSQIIVCEDDGVGIPVNEKEMIFGQGFGRNTGMGLFLAREILNITGITIRETGEPDKGARFELTVPKEAYRSLNAK